jgi:hypothetical protein
MEALKFGDRVAFFSTNVQEPMTARLAEVLAFGRPLADGRQVVHLNVHSHPDIDRASGRDAVWAARGVPVFASAESGQGASWCVPLALHLANQEEVNAAAASVTFTEPEPPASRTGPRQGKREKAAV